MDWGMMKLKKSKGEGEDRLSELPDNLIHHILWFCDAQIAVQTSVLSKRWKLIWATLPFLNFKRFRNSPTSDAEIKFINNFFFRRNYDSDVLKLNLSVHFPPDVKTHLINKFISYSVSHNVQELTVNVRGFYFVDAIMLSRYSGLSSDTINKLVVTINFFDISKEELGLSWRLPCLETLHLIRPYYQKSYELCESSLDNFPCLRNLVLDGFVLPSSISLPALTTLVLHIVKFPENSSNMFYSLVNLRNLTLFFRGTVIMYSYVINCPQLVNLEISAHGTAVGDSGQIIVSSQKIQNFSSVSFFPIQFKVSKLENVNIKSGVSDFPVTEMLRGLGNARIFTLALDLRTIEALSAVSDFLAPPLINLKYVKVPPGYSKSSMSTNLRRYLLGYSPKATIVTPLSQKNNIPDTATTSLTAQNVVLQEPLAAPTRMLVGSKTIHKTVCIDTMDRGVQEEQVVQNSAVNADRARQISGSFEGTSNGMSSSRGSSDFRLWRGHEVNSEFVCLLDIIMNKYPETFEHFIIINKKFCTMKLNMLCTSVNVFTKICMNQVDAEMIAEHRAVFTALQNLGFNVSWLVNRLDFIERLRFSQPLLPELDAIDCEIDDAKSKLQDLQIRIKDLLTLRAEKMQEIQKVFGTMGANLLVGCVGDDLLSGP